MAVSRGGYPDRDDLRRRTGDWQRLQWGRPDCGQRRVSQCGHRVTEAGSKDSISAFFSQGAWSKEVRTVTAANDRHHPDRRGDSREPARVDSSTRVNLALPFSQFKIQEPSDRLIALAALVEDLAELVADAMPSPEAEALRNRAHELASQAR
jgi:hypothetical protein